MFAQNKHNYEISHPYEWGEMHGETSCLHSTNLCMCRMRKMRQDVNYILYWFSSANLILLCSYGRFSKSINPDDCGRSYT
jgi:hypothetical protein